uniref:Venom dipeptidyl peptidase 4 n=1 Tax=Dermatophagoides pteronyssinus TaxID=6956 RepID=A0A6P6XVF4_DERPT|nr:prolyl endopeptidase FAP-like [Dermatophagoides pteronyssinus]
MNPISLYFTSKNYQQNTPERERYRLYNNQNQSIQNYNSIRQKLLQQNFSDQIENVRLISLYRYHTFDHMEITDDNNQQQQLQQQSSLNQINQQRNHRSPLSISTLSHNHHHHHHSNNIPIESSKIFPFNLIRNVFYMSSTIPKKRKFLSAITLLILVSIFCLISSSLVNVLISSSSPSSTSSSSSILQQSSSSLFPYLAKANDNNNNELANNIDNRLQSSSSYLQPIELDEIFRDELSANLFNGSWISNNEIAFYDVEYNFCLYDVDQQITKRFIHFIQVLTKNLRGLQLSKDKQYLLWSKTEPTELFRYSKFSRLKIYDIHNDSIINLFDDPLFVDIHFQWAEWGPKNSQLIFIYNNNIYYRHTARSDTIRLTVTGVDGIIFNGHCDWLYEEEILNQAKAFWFSPNGDYLAYLQINDTLVDMVVFKNFGDYSNVTTNQYPHLRTIRYPKPGQHNPQVTIYVVNLHSQSENIHTIRIEPPSKKLFNERDFYISRVIWYDDERLLIVWTKRNQQRSLLTICDSNYQWKCQELYDLKSKTGWVDGFEDGLLSAAFVDQVIIRIPKFGSKIRGDFYHIAAINIKDKSINFLTHGDYDVIKLIHYSPITNEVYYASTLSNHPEVQHIMKTTLTIKSDTVCLTCYLGNSCRNNEAHFNELGTYYILECKGYEIPRVELRNAQTNELIEIFEENRKLFRFLQTKFIPRYEKIYVKLADNYDAIVEFILPHDFNEERRYPMVIELYGAPGTQMIKDKYEMNHWSSYLTSKHQYIYAKIDCRGTANQGLRHMHQLYRNVGRIEVDDLINVVWFLKNNLTYVDPDRIALWGWSYGGYYSLMSLIKQFDHRLFSCAIAVAPVSNWMFYDSAYTEKYFGIPNNDDIASIQPYQNANLLDLVGGLRNRKFLLIYGTGDDNVHDQHTLMLIKQLIQSNIDYDVQIYPDDNHFLSRSNQHLYTRMTKFLQEKCFGYSHQL